MALFCRSCATDILDLHTLQLHDPAAYTHVCRCLYKLLLREPREVSQRQRLLLSAALAESQLQQAYEARICSSDNSSNSSSLSRGCSGGGWLCAAEWQTFAGVDWQLMCRFVRAGARRSTSWYLAVGVRFAVPGASTLVPPRSAVLTLIPLNGPVPQRPQIMHPTTAFEP